ncbi:MAG TPA: MerR family transcriptional regulator [Burkholderiales bacterium]|nr:MerR family transcriptional regulator [Burkholderiales bacterium]
MRQESFTIGKLARRANVGVETIRYYQAFGLLQEPAKPQTGYRRYPLAALERLHFIKRAQGLGFSLKEISRLLAPSTAPESRALAAGKLDAVRTEIAHLIMVRAVLEDLIRRCDAHPSPGTSPIVSALSGLPEPIDAVQG